MLEVIALPAFDDNYFWLLHDGAGHAAVVDPGAAAVVEAALSRHGLELTAILVTHHHFDHIGGIPELIGGRRIPVYGPHEERIPDIDHPLSDGDTVELQSMGVCLQVMQVPGHTRSHLAYRTDAALFCGDTLFASGCGRLFEGSPAQMLDSLDRIGALPPTTLAYPAHEYTLANCRFAASIEPDNLALRERHAQVQALRAAGQPSVPSALSVERECNPFLRVDCPAVRAAFALAQQRAAVDRVEVFAWLRKLKDEFRG